MLLRDAFNTFQVDILGILDTRYLLSTKHTLTRRWGTWYRVCWGRTSARSSRPCRWCTRRCAGDCRQSAVVQNHYSCKSTISSQAWVGSGENVDCVRHKARMHVTSPDWRQHTSSSSALPASSPLIAWWTLNIGGLYSALFRNRVFSCIIEQFSAELNHRFFTPPTAFYWMIMGLRMDQQELECKIFWSHTRKNVQNFAQH